MDTERLVDARGFRILVPLVFVVVEKIFEFDDNAFAIVVLGWSGPASGRSNSSMFCHLSRSSIQSHILSYTQFYLLS